MSMSRREFGIALSSGFVLLLSGRGDALENLPPGVTHNSDDAAHQKSHVDAGVHHMGHAKASSISDAWAPIRLGRGAPVTGAAGFEIDQRGFWTFSGHFYDSGGQNDRAAIVIGLKSAGEFGALFLFETSGIMSVSDGGKRAYSWYKQGRSYGLQDGWKDLQKGHSWAGHASYRGPEAIGPALGGMFSGIGNAIAGVQPSSTAPGNIDIAGLENAVEMRLKSVGKVIRICR